MHTEEGPHPFNNHCELSQDLMSLEPGLTLTRVLKRLKSQREAAENEVRSAMRTRHLRENIGDAFIAMFLL